jgi:hypothetical protein
VTASAIYRGDDGAVRLAATSPRSGSR